MIRLYILLGAFALVAFLGWHYRDTLAENEVLKNFMATANKYISAQDQVIIKNREIEEQERNEIDTIEAQPPQNDGPIAPVLRDTLGRM